MKRFSLLLLCSLFLCLLCVQAQERGFVLKGCLLGAKDGITIALMAEEDSLFKVLAETKMKGDCFELRGEVKHPILCTLTTNNLDLVTANGWPTDSIYWTYTSVFVENVPMKLETRRYKDVPSDWSATPDFKIVGGEVQADYTELGRMRYEAAKGNIENLGGVEDALIWKFILSHPRSVVSAYYANHILERGYNLTAEQVSQLEKAIVDVPADKARFELFKERIEYAKHTTVGAELVDLEMTDTKGKVIRLAEIVPKGKFVLVDFWASWCGMCLAAMPDIRKLEKQYQGDFVVIPVSCDLKPEAWRNAMKKHNMPEPQYILTKQGYDDFFHKYQVGNGVPYYTLIAPDGKVMKAPSGTEEIATVMEHYCK